MASKDRSLVDSERNACRPCELSCVCGSCHVPLASSCTKETHLHLRMPCLSSAQRESRVLCAGRHSSRLLVGSYLFAPDRHSIRSDDCCPSKGGLTLGWSMSCTTKSQDFEHWKSLCLTNKDLIALRPTTKRHCLSMLLRSGTHRQ